MSQSTSPRPTISVAIIALNEAARLPRLLEQLHWADEVVVVDGGSTDDTAELAAQRGCRVVSHPFDHFAAQRNRALRACSGDWVLAIDADETPTSQCVSAIRAAIRDERYSGWRVPIRSRIFGQRFRYSGTQDDSPVRLVRRGSGLWLGAVHEVLHVDGAIGRMDHGFTHDTIPDLGAFFAKVERYTTLGARMRVAADCPPRWLDALVAPPREIARRLIWKRGIFDGPRGWLFCVLSGWSEWVLARKHRGLWKSRLTAGLSG